MFEWNWASVASECTTFLGPAGYGFVQGPDCGHSLLQDPFSLLLPWIVSPPGEHISGTQWWTDYQPVSYTLTSKRGSRAQFASMVTTCHAAGVKVIVGAALDR